MSSISIWTRLGNWLRLSQSQGEDNAAGATDAERAHTADSLTVANEPASSTELSGAKRWQRREQVLQKLQEGYGQVIDLLSSVRQHLETYELHNHRMNEAITRLAESMSELPSRSAGQAELLEGLGRQMEEQGARQEKVAAAVEHWPETARGQAEQLDRLHQEVGKAQEGQAEVAGSLQSVNQTIGELTQAIGQGSKLIEALDKNMAGRHEQTLGVLEAQDKRMVQLIWAAMGLAGVAIVGAVIGILMHYRGGG